MLDIDKLTSLYDYAKYAYMSIQINEAILDQTCVVSSVKFLGLRLDATENDLRDEGSCQRGDEWS